MDPKTVLAFQLEGSLNMVLERAQALDEEGWKARALPGTSKLGFILWHAGRIVDWGVHRGLRGVAELADLPLWSSVQVPGALAGFGIPDEVADKVPETVDREQFIRYLGGVREAVLPWFSACSVKDLERPVDLRSHLATASGYLEPAVWTEIATLDGVPGWQFLARPCVSHVRVHIGEFDVLLGARQARPEESPVS